MTAADTSHDTSQPHACCAVKAVDTHQNPGTQAGSHTLAPHAGHAHASGWRGAASVTLHCLSGCAIGELLGLVVGVGLGWNPRITVALAVVLSFVSGFALTLLPMLRRGFGLLSSLRTVWLGEIISISVMELVMNIVDFQMGGMRGVSLTSTRYWEAFGMALVAGFVAAWPINRWMLARNMQRCH